MANAMKLGTSAAVPSLHLSFERHFSLLHIKIKVNIEILFFLNIFFISYPHFYKKEWLI